MLKVDNVTVSFGGVTAVENVSFEAHDGQVLGIIGPNGAGKTTLFNAICGLVPIKAGCVFLGNQDISRWPIYRRGLRKLARTLQTPAVFSHISVCDNLVAAILACKRYSLSAVGLGWPPTMRQEAQARAQAEKLLASSLLNAERDSLAGGLSFGHQRLLEIYRALVSDPQVLLLDEPLAGLSREEANGVLNLVHSIGQQKRAVLMVEHDLPSVMAVADRILVLAEGRILADGSPEAVRNDLTVRRVYLGESESESFSSSGSGKGSSA